MQTRWVLLVWQLRSMRSGSDAEAALPVQTLHRHLSITALCCMPVAALCLQKLFQAVEEARALLAEGAAAASRQQRKRLALASKAGQQAGPQQQRPQRRQRSQTPDRQQQQQQQQGAGKPEQDAAGTVQVPAYPPPVREDMGRSSKQLLKWLKAAAADPMVR